LQLPVLQGLTIGAETIVRIHFFNKNLIKNIIFLFSKRFFYFEIYYNMKSLQKLSVNVSLGLKKSSLSADDVPISYWNVLSPYVTKLQTGQGDHPKKDDLPVPKE